MSSWFIATSFYTNVLLYIVITTSAITVCNCWSSSEEDIKNKTLVRMYRDGNSSQFKEFLIEDGVKMVTSPDFDSSKDLVLVIHGAKMGADDPHIEAIIDAFGTSGKSKHYNILAMHMPELFQFNWENIGYIGSICKTDIVGRIIGDFLGELIKRGLTDASRINIIGFCLGCHLAAYAGRQVAKEFNTPIGYIAGLDPVDIGYSWLFGTKPLREGDARVVHQMHTSAYYFSNKHGTADFIFNGGLFQPGCASEPDKVVCSHYRSVVYFAEAVTNNRAFEAISCTSVKAFNSCECDDEENHTKWITFPPDLSAVGRYFVRTWTKSPFGAGEQGTEGALCSSRDTWTEDSDIH